MTDRRGGHRENPWHYTAQVTDSQGKHLASLVEKNRNRLLTQLGNLAWIHKQIQVHLCVIEESHLEKKPKEIHHEWRNNNTEIDG